jgi:hypothetical protein
MGRKVTKLKVSCSQRLSLWRLDTPIDEVLCTYGPPLNSIDSITCERIFIDAVDIMSGIGLTKVLVLCDGIIRHVLQVIDNVDVTGLLRGGAGELPGVVPAGCGCVAICVFT